MCSFLFCLFCFSIRIDRMQQAGIPSPKPIFLRMHVLMMEFLGKNGWCGSFCVVVSVLDMFLVLSFLLFHSTNNVREGLPQS